MRSTYYKFKLFLIIYYLLSIIFFLCLRIYAVCLTRKRKNYNNMNRIDILTINTLFAISKFFLASIIYICTARNVTLLTHFLPYLEKKCLPLNANFRITASADCSRCHHVSAVAIARIVQCQYVAAVNVADDRRQHYGKNPRSDFSRLNDGDQHFTDATTRVGIQLFAILWRKKDSVRLFELQNLSTKIDMRRYLRTIDTWNIGCKFIIAIIIITICRFIINNQWPVFRQNFIISKIILILI